MVRDGGDDGDDEGDDDDGDDDDAEIQCHTCDVALASH
jgi:hypothetical protein